MMSFSRDHQNQLGRRASFTRLFETTNWKGATANTDSFVAPALCALPYEDRRASVLLPVIHSVSSLMSTPFRPQFPHPNFVTP
jgi:hypothetical protein